MSGELIADINNDGQVDIEDLFILLQNYGKVESNNIADINNNGQVDIGDLLELLGAFGSTT